MPNFDHEKKRFWDLNEVTKTGHRIEKQKRAEHKSFNPFGFIIAPKPKHCSS